MEFLLKSAGRPASVGILAGSFHPITRAHVALAQAARGAVDEVLFVMPRRFPHKEYEQVGLPDRIDLVRRAAEPESDFSVAITEGGLFIDIAREAREHYPGADLWFLCGADAAQRIVEWNYGPSGDFDRQLEEFGLLVADRQRRYEAPPRLAERVRPLDLGDDWHEVSATEVRRRLAAGERWEELVPDPIVEHVARLYGVR